MRRRPALTAGAATLALASLAGVGSGLLAHDVLTARSELVSAAEVAGQARAAAAAGDLHLAGKRLRAVQRHSGAARAGTSGRRYAVAAALPWVGDDLRAARTVAREVDALARGPLPVLLQVGAGLRPQTLWGADGTVVLEPLTRAAPALAGANARVSGAAEALAAVPRDGLTAGVRSGVAEAADTARRLASTTGTAARLAAALPDALGAHGPRRWLLVFQNPTESRGSGGIVAAYAVLSAEDGRVRVERMGSNRDLAGHLSRADLGADFRSVYGLDRLLVQNATLSPHFPYAGQALLDIFRAATGERVDGVLATDPVALAHLLQATGPVPLPSGGTVDAANAARLVMHDVYARFPSAADDARRDAWLQTVEESVLSALLAGRAEPASLASALARIAGEGRLQVWSTREPVQAAVRGTVLAGTLPAGTGPFLGVSHVQLLPNKIDWYLRREADYRVGPTRPDGTRLGHARVSLRNDAPARGLPAYVSPGTQHGRSRLRLSLHLTPGAVPLAATVDGRAVPVTIGREQGRPVCVLTVELPPGSARVVALEVREPAGGPTPTLWLQPGIPG